MQLLTGDLYVEITYYCTFLKSRETLIINFQRKIHQTFGRNN